MRELQDAAAAAVDDPEIDVLSAREERPVEEALQPVLQEGRRIRDGERRSGRAAGGAEVDGLGPSGESFAPEQSHVARAGRRWKIDEEAPTTRGRRHVGEVRDRHGVVAAAGQAGGEDEQRGSGASAHGSRIR